SGAIVTALALALSVYVMAPLASDIEARLASSKGEPALGSVLSLAKDPARDFLARNAGREERALFVELSRARGVTVTGDEFSLLWASFALHELKQAFYLGFLVYLPFLVLDLVVASALLSLGLSGLTPQAVALPFKLLLFASVDGFALVSRALVLGYK
ncbi:MAG TPA: flagellar type III secretion system pore protein FliP, partial [Polyangiales bacterium]